MGKKQTKVTVHVGMAPGRATFDVSKGTLDIRALQEKDEQLLAPMKVTNDDAGADACIKYLTEYAVKLVVFEATGGFEVLIALRLQAAGIPLAIINPRRIRHFAQAEGYLAKTDLLDAAMLARDTP